MGSQLDFLDDVCGTRENVRNLPEGFKYQSELIGPDDERALLTHVRDLPFCDFEFYGYMGKRRVISFGWDHDFTGRKLKKADDIPDYLFSP